MMGVEDSASFLCGLASALAELAESSALTALMTSSFDETLSAARRTHDFAQAAAQTLDRLAELTIDFDPRHDSQRPCLYPQLVRPPLEPDGKRTPDPPWRRVVRDVRGRIGAGRGRFDRILDEPSAELVEVIEGLLARLGEPMATPAPHAAAGAPSFWPEPSDRPAVHIPDRPHRDPDLFHDGPLPSAGIDPAERTRALLHLNITEVEIATIEACCRLILAHREMPWGFVVDMARQAWDEARHARAFLRRLRELEGRVGDYGSTYLLWDMGVGQPLGVRLTLHQRIGEWHGVDGALFHAEDAAARFDVRTASLFEFVARDEITHVAMGNRWLHYVAGEPAERARLTEQAERIRVAFGKEPESGPLPFPLTVWACRRAGFDEDELSRFVARARRHGARSGAAPIRDPEALPAGDGGLQTPHDCAIRSCHQTRRPHQGSSRSIRSR